MAEELFAPENVSRLVDLLFAPENLPRLTELFQQTGYQEVDVQNLKGRLFDPQNAGEFQGRDVSDADPPDYGLMVWSEDDQEWTPMAGSVFLGGLKLGDLGDVGTVSYDAGKVLRADGDSYESAFLKHSDIYDDEPLQHIDWTNATETFKTTGWVGIGITPETNLHVGGTPGYFLMENGRPVCWKDSGGTMRSVIYLSTDDDLIFGGQDGILNYLLIGGYGAYLRPERVVTVHGNMNPADLWLRRIENSPPDDTILANLNFAWGKMSGTKVKYASVQGIAADVSSGAEKGALAFLLADSAGAGFPEQMRLDLDALWLSGGVLGLAETTKPTSRTGYNELYGKADQKLYYLDHGGTEHRLGEQKEEHVPLITLAAGQSF